MFDRLEDLVLRYEELMNELNSPDIVNDQTKFRKVMKEQNELAPIVEAYNAYKKAKQSVEDSLAILDTESDEDMRELAKEELNDAKEQIEYGFQYCDVLKISDNEIQFVSGKEDYDEGIRYLQEKYQIPLIFLTMGKDGSRAYYKDMRVERKGFAVKAIETTGAGDTFCGCAVNGVLTHGLDNLTEEILEDILTYANAGAALITMKKGAIRSMPEPEDIKRLAEG